MGLSKYRITAIVLTIVAVALVAYSMSLPWYHISRTGYLSDSPNISYIAGTYDFHRDFCIWKSPEGSSHIFTYNVPMDGTDPIGLTMNVEAMAVLIWVILAILFLISTFRDDELLSYGFGIALGLVPIVAVVYFVIVIDDRIRESLLFGPMNGGFVGHGFIGNDPIWSWGPLAGWYLVLVALVLQIPAVIVGIYGLRHER